MNIVEKLMHVQKGLKVAKEQTNTFGKYKYRSCEDILEAVKPLLSEVGAIILLNDEVCMIGERFYIKATASFIGINPDETNIGVSAYAREDLDKKGMDLAQVTGSTSSYARKYALNGLLCIDDTKDSDTTNTGDKPEPKKPDVKVNLVTAYIPPVQPKPAEVKQTPAPAAQIQPQGKPDVPTVKPEEEKPTGYICEECTKPIKAITTDKNRYSAVQVAEMTIERTGRQLCWACALKESEAKKAAKTK